jgi:K+-sensing histidine kinase KdpD
MTATEHPVPVEELTYARRLGAKIIIERGDVVKTLIAFARTMSIDYFVTGRSFRSRFSFTWRLPLTETLQRKLPNTIMMIV